MAKRKGMSLEDKRQTLLGIFHETRDVFILKDIEKLGAKRGVVLQSVKEVLQGLVDDSMVHQEKIGVSNYFWAFPSEHAVALETEQKRLQQRLQERRAEREVLQQRIEQSKVGKENSEERQELLKQLQQLQALVAARKEELAGYAENDPERYDRLKESCKVACDSANRWIDNIDALRGWLKKRFDGMDGQIDELFKESGIKEDTEYLKMEPLP